ncbi:MAG: T9SS type A sorting domain-containing protein, partial [Chlorobi bacterium]|nr:T9SS type A sorting domain-containing protein [Chlorobiota bacterium]
DGAFEYSGIVEVEIELPTKFELYQNYPNPFSKGSGGSSVTTIKYSIPQVETQNPDKSGQVFASQQVTLKVFDILGREISTLVNAKQAPGNYEVRFNGNKLPSGIYLYQLQSKNFIKTKKMVLIR